MVKILDRLYYAMMFGALEKCPECSGDGQLEFRSSAGYQCTGNVSEWTKCRHRTTKPERVEFKLPGSYRKQFDFCKLYKSKPNTPTTIPRSSSQESLDTTKGTSGSNGYISTGRGIWSQTWVGLTMILAVSPSCNTAMPILPDSYLPQQNMADGGTAKNKVNTNQVRYQMPHPVFVTSLKQ